MFPMLCHTSVPWHTMQIEPIATIHTPYPTKFGVPRQPGLAPTLLSTVVFEPSYALTDAIRELDDFEYIWLIWAFSHNMHNQQANDSSAHDHFQSTVRPPRLGGTRRVGVFATRSSFRPNSLAISAVKLMRIDYDSQHGPILVVSGADMVDGTPLYDIKPYLPYCDAHPDAAAGWVQEQPWPELLDVEISDELMAKVPHHLRQGLIDVLRQDPRPAYTRTSQQDRRFWVPLEDLVCWFAVRDKTVHVIAIEHLDERELEELRRSGTVHRLEQ